MHGFADTCMRAAMCARSSCAYNISAHAGGDWWCYNDADRRLATERLVAGAPVPRDVRDLQTLKSYCCFYERA